MIIIFIISLEESIALVEDSYLANLEAELKKERVEKEKRVNDLTNALKNGEAKLDEMKLKRDSIKGQVHHLSLNLSYFYDYLNFS